MCCFIMETRKTDGSCYPPATLQSLVCGLNRELQRNGASFSTMDKGDSRFRPLLKTLDSLSCELHKQGIGAVKNSANIIEKEHEAIFGRRVSLGTLLRRFFSAQYSFMWVSTLLSEVFKISMNWSLPNFSMCLWTLRSMMNLCIIITRNSFLKTTSTGLKISMPGTRQLKRMPYEEVNRALSSWWILIWNFCLRPALTYICRDLKGFPLIHPKALIKTNE